MALVGLRKQHASGYKRLASYCNAEANRNAESMCARMVSLGEKQNLRSEGMFLRFTLQKRDPELNALLHDPSHHINKKWFLLSQQNVCTPNFTCLL